MSTTSFSGRSTNTAQTAAATLLYHALTEMASRDEEASRLAHFLRGGPRRPEDLSFGMPKVGSIRAAQLVQVMAMSPFLNPQMRRWIRNVLQTRGLTVSKSLAKDADSARDAMNVSRRSALNLLGRNSNLSGFFEEEVDRALNSSVGRSSSQARNMSSAHGCFVKLKNGYPSKALSKLSIDEICRMIKDIEGTTSVSEPALEERVRRMNLSGTVLSVCNLNDLKAELNMNFGDWQLFIALIEYLRKLEVDEIVEMKEPLIYSKITRSQLDLQNLLSMKRSQELKQFEGVDNVYINGGTLAKLVDEKKERQSSRKSTGSRRSRGGKQDEEILSSTISMTDDMNNSTSISIAQEEEDSLSTFAVLSPVKVMHNHHQLGHGAHGKCDCDFWYKLENSLGKRGDKPRAEDEDSPVIEKSGQKRRAGAVVESSSETVEHDSSSCSSLLAEEASFSSNDRSYSSMFSSEGSSSSEDQLQPPVVPNRGKPRTLKETKT
ncbi:hypothetical protein Ciccas_003193 [Cichlidogyrus casuarinus]|uniref:Kinase D-interacting substrate of 220 kDa-like SAM domain-containing protein n=1 Tax=Cichlidogyrus casuarinus TaxID=1844966 RepID=A0ABD2QF31_9PLAT